MGIGLDTMAHRPRLLGAHEAREKLAEGLSRFGTESGSGQGDEIGKELGHRAYISA
jgi:hypothetical protein